MQNNGPFYPFKVVQVLFERLLGPCVGRLVSHVRVLLVARAAVVLGAVRLPIAKAHPAKVVLATVALHVIAPSVLLYTDLALGAYLYDYNFQHLLYQYI